MIGNSIHRFKELTSTNSYMKEHFDLFSEGEIVVSEIQTAGRGRFGHQWISEKGNLYFSFNVCQNISRDHVFEWVMKTAVAVYECLRQFDLNCTIKYPNDIYIKDRKISGILVESAGYENIDSFIIGVGINVNQDQFQEMSAQPTSLKLETSKTFELEDVLKSFIAEFNRLNDAEEVFKIYKNHLEFKKNQWMISGISYKISGINRTGEIIVETSSRQMAISDAQYSALIDKF